MQRTGEGKADRGGGEPGFIPDRSGVRMQRMCEVDRDKGRVIGKGGGGQRVAASNQGSEGRRSVSAKRE